MYLETCGGKGTYTKRQVQERKNRLESRGRERLRYYQCPDCDYWHLTKLSKYRK